MAKFKGFNTQQTYQLLTELGYDGPARQEQMDAFVAATPSAGSMLGRYTEIAKQRVEGEPLSGIGMSDGGPVNPKDAAKESGVPVMKDFGADDQDDMALIYFPDGSMVNVQKGYAEAYLNHAKNTGATINSRDDYNNFTLDVSKKSADPYSVEAAVQKQGNDLTLGYRDSKQGKTIDQLNEEANKYNAENKLLKNVGTVSAAPLPEDFDAQIAAIKAAQEEGNTEGAQKLVDDLRGQADIPAPVIVEAEKILEGTEAEAEVESTKYLDNIEDAFSKGTEADDTAADAIVADVETKIEGLLGQEATDGVGKILIEKHNYKKGSDGLYYAPDRDFPEGVTDATTDTTVIDDEKVDDTVLDDTVVDDDTTTSTTLDEAQKAYADAQKVLTDAQKAFNEIEKPEAPDLSKIEYPDVNPNVQGFDDLVSSGDLPEDMSDYEITGKSKNWIFTFPNGQSLTVTDFKNKDTAAEIISLSVAGAINAIKTDPVYVKYQKDLVPYKQAEQKVKDAESLVESTYGDLLAAEERTKVTDIPSVSESLAKTISSPEDLVTNQEVYKIKAEDGQLIDSETGQVLDAKDVIVKLATQAGAIDTPAVKTAIAYLAGLDPMERMKKYPPAVVPMVTPLPEATKKSIAEYYKNQQAQIEQDAIKSRAETYEAVTSQENVKTALEDFAAATGTPSDEALMKAETMSPEDLAQLDLSPATIDTIRQIPEVKRNLEAGELPTAEIFDSYTKSTAQQIEQQGDIEAAKFADDTPKAEAEVDYTLDPTSAAKASITKVSDAAKFSEEASAEEKKSEFEPDLTAEETNVSDSELVDVNKIINVEEIVVTGATLTALNEDSKGKAQTATFSQQLEAKFVLGEVSPQSTVEGQLEKLMASFDDGTPAWAAGALRRVNEVMNARGLGGSSMVGAAMIQAAMESAIPIAQADAATFAAMDLENVRNKQTVALANAAAAQKFELQNLTNRQAMAVQNSMNNTNLQLTNLSNTQEAVLAQAQLRAGLQNITLGISENVALANASRYAEVNNLNLTNRQQMSILESTQNLEVEMTNLSNSQQTALSNLQVKASMMGQVLSNEQQMAVIESTQAFETEMQNATNKQQAFIQDAVAKAAMEGRVLDNRQQTSLFNVSNQLAEREIELNNEQQTRMFNMTNKLNIEVENLSARQQTALANAQIEAAMKGQELTNKQQVNIIRSERIAEIANLNFTAEQTRAIRNSELAQTVDLANLDSRSAKLLADCAALTQIDTTNLSNRQQAATQQAQAFLQMDMANLDNQQQATMFEAQSLVQSIFSDQAAENVALQFNAESVNQVNQFFDTITAQVEQFNTAQNNAMEQFNAGEENTIAKFQAELDNQRDIFNAQNQLVIAQANAVWRQSIATINNASMNEATMREAMTANNLTAQGIAELWQQERDLMNYAWTTSEKQLDRDFELLKAKINNDSGEDAAFSSAAGMFLSSVIGAVGEAGGIGSFFS